MLPSEAASFGLLSFSIYSIFPSLPLVPQIMDGELLLHTGSGWAAGNKRAECGQGKNKSDLVGARVYIFLSLPAWIKLWYGFTLVLSTTARAAS